MRAEYYQQYKYTTKALKLYEYLSKYWRHEHKMTEYIDTMFKIGIWYRQLSQHKKACDIFKKILQKAWENSDQQLELKVYENLSYEHYHLGNASKAKYYFLRYHRGWLETKDSALRKFYIQALQMNLNYKNLYKDKLNENEIMSHEDKTFLPSPSDGRSTFIYLGKAVSNVNAYRTLDVDTMQAINLRQRESKSVLKHRSCSLLSAQPPRPKRAPLTEKQMKEKVNHWMRGHLRKPHKPRTFKEIIEIAVKNKNNYK